ncbi:6-phosphogluconolactonase [Dermatobacter hominis]|uniref:6-phosphogluconolactonase n=1 Tax=Dermatobacter hominis TaxID=2884263 RepID=UPI001D10361A|nr:6-phosphogluconolactonase [Dermatobacter hominis]UDY35323.1 6-phosphogluconolactonase [Dermatobacter hominis]
MDHEQWVVEDADGVAATAADHVAQEVRRVVDERGAFTFAVSGGRSPWAMLTHLAHQDLPWEAVSIWQVDERIAPAGDADRNLVGLADAVAALPVTVHPMPVEELLGDGPGDATEDEGAIAAACDAYAASLPDRFDLIHLGIGPDGHTASLVPGDEVLGVTDHAVAVTSTAYQGRRRMTLTYPALGRTDQLLWLITGEEKREALAGVLAGDPIYPASKVEAPRSIIVADRAAHPQQP